MADDDLRRDLRIEGLLRDWNIEFTFDVEVPLRKLDTGTDATQVRQVEHRAPRETVEEYATQMRAGAHFPPMVATHNFRMIDGNTRKKAAELSGFETFPAYLVKLPQATFGPMIGAALNQMGGKRLSDDEAFAAAETMIRGGIADDAIARTIGKSAQSIRNYRRQTRFKDAAERTGLSDLPLRATAQRALADITLDRPFAEAARLVATAKLSQGDTQDLVTQIEQARSEQAALDVIADANRKHAPAGPPPHKQNRTKAATTAGRKIDTFLQAVNAPAGDLAPATLRPELEPKWRRLHELAGAVLKQFADNPPLPEPEAPAAS